MGKDNDKSRLTKKEQADAAAARSGALATGGTNTAVQGGQRAAGDKLAATFTPNADGSLSPYGKAAYGQDVREDNDVYGNIMRKGLRGLAYRGFGSAPSGMEASIINTAGNEQGAADTAAYAKAQEADAARGLDILKYRLGMQGVYNPIPAYSTAGSIATAGGVRPPTNQDAALAAALNYALSPNSGGAS